MKTLLQNRFVARGLNEFGFALLWIVFTAALLYRVSLTRDLWEPYAEDGSALILGALAAPWNLFAPVVDALFVLPRLFATIATSLSLIQAPFILSVFSSATVAFVALYLVRPSLSLVAPSPAHRFMLSLLVAGGIGTLEVAGFAQCISYSLTLFLIIIAVRATPMRSRWMMPVVFLLSLSTNFAFIAAPLFVIRGIVDRARNFIACGLLTLVPVPLILACAALSQAPTSIAQFKGFLEPLVSIVDRGLFYLFAVPVSGGLLSNSNRLWQFLTMIASIGLYLTMWRKSSRRARLFSLGFVLAAVFYLAAHEFGRAYPITGSMLDFRLTSDRYAFILLPCVVMAWSVLLFDQRWLPGFVQSLFFSLMIMVQLLTTVLHGDRLSSMSSAKSWGRFASQLSEARMTPAGGQINDAALGPIHWGFPWGLIHCETSEVQYIRCMDLRGNRDGAVYDIPRFQGPSVR